MKGLRLKIAEWGILFLRFVTGDAFDKAIVQMVANLSERESIRKTKIILEKERLNLCSHPLCCVRFSLRKKDGKYWCQHHYSYQPSTPAAIILILFLISACAPTNSQIKEAYDQGFKDADNQCIELQLRVVRYIQALKERYDLEDKAYKHLKEMEEKEVDGSEEWVK